jgi:uncharacterized protein YjbJ (UPF0337 family)
MNPSECSHLGTGKKNHSQIGFKPMNTTQVKGNWNEQKGKLKQAFSNVTDDDLMFADGKKDEMYGKLQKKLGKTREELDDVMSGK